MNNKNWLAVGVVVLIAFGIYGFYNDGVSQSPVTLADGEQVCQAKPLSKCIDKCWIDYEDAKEDLNAARSTMFIRCCEDEGGQAMVDDDGNAIGCIWGSEVSDEGYNDCLAPWRKMALKAINLIVDRRNVCVAGCMAAFCADPEEIEE